MGDPPMDLCYTLGGDLARAADQLPILALGVIAGLLLAWLKGERALAVVWIWGLLVVLLSQIQASRYQGSPRFFEEWDTTLKAWVDSIPALNSWGPAHLEMSYLLSVYIIGVVPAIVYGFGLGKMMKFHE